MTFDIRAAIARLNSRPFSGGTDSFAYEQAVLQFNGLLIAAKSEYPLNLDLQLLKVFDHPTIVKVDVFGDAINRLSDALEHIPKENPSDTRLISEKFGILYSHNQLQKDFENYQDESTGMAILFFDIDHFKALNTKYTETIVDRDLLIPYQRSILELVRHRGFAYSVGGDEFIILLVNVTQDEAISFGKRLLEFTRSSKFVMSGDSVQITLSIGLALFPADTDSFETLRQLANLAENKAKANGRNQVFYNDQVTPSPANLSNAEEKPINDVATVKVFPETTVFFYERFCSAFPGVRGVQWIDNREEAILRLCKLLAPPLSLTKANYNGTFSPVWWWRGGNLHIQNFNKLTDDVVLLDWHELKIEKIAAVNLGSYYQCFVYVQASPMEATGLYPRTQDQIEWCIEKFGYCSDEYGLYRNKHIVTRAEYDDGSAIIDGELIDFHGNIDLRVRYITPYNFIIAAQDCPINNLRFDQKLQELMNDTLKGHTSLEQVAEIISRLPKRERHG